MLKEVSVFSSQIVCRWTLKGLWGCFNITWLKFSNAPQKAVSSMSVCALSMAITTHTAPTPWKACYGFLSGLRGQFVSLEHERPREALQQGKNEAHQGRLTLSSGKVVIQPIKCILQPIDSIRLTPEYPLDNLSALSTTGARSTENFLFNRHNYRRKMESFPCNIKAKVMNKNLKIKKTSALPVSLI